MTEECVYKSYTTWKGENCIENWSRAVSEFAYYIK